MNAQELRESFITLYDVKANFAAPGYENSEISGFLNLGQMELVEAMLRANQIDLLRELYRVHNFLLSPCTIEWLGDCAYQSNMMTNDKFLHHVNSNVLIASRTTILPISNQWVNAKLITRLEAPRFIQQVSNQPLLVYPRVLLHHVPAGGIMEITDTSQPPTPIIPSQVIPIVLIDKYCTLPPPEQQALEFTYLKYPITIDIDNEITSELNPRLHQKLVDLAVRRAILASDDSRMQQQQQPQQQQSQPDE